MKKEHRKSDTLVVEALGPALFSTPDIIRRVGSTTESKVPDSPPVSIPTMLLVGSSSTSTSTTVVTTARNLPTISTPSTCMPVPSTSLTTTLNEPMGTSLSVNDSDNAHPPKLDTGATILSETLEHDKVDSKTAIAELLQPALDSGK